MVILRHAVDQPEGKSRVAVHVPRRMGRRKDLARRLTNYGTKATSEDKLVGAGKEKHTVVNDSNGSLPLEIIRGLMRIFQAVERCGVAL